MPRPNLASMPWTPVIEFQKARPFRSDRLEPDQGVDIERRARRGARGPEAKTLGVNEVMQLRFQDHVRPAPVRSPLCT